MKPLLNFAILTLLAVTVHADAIYVSSSRGNNAQPGTASAPVASLQRAVELAQPGDTLLLQPGDVWRESVKVIHDDLTVQAWPRSASGDESPPAPPAITGAVELSAFQPTGSPNLWRAAFDQQPIQLMRNGQRQQRVATVGNLRSDGQWHWDENSAELTIFSFKQPSPMEVTVRDFCVDLGRTHGVTLRGLALRNAGLANLQADEASGWTLDACEITGSYVNGVRASSLLPTNQVLIQGNRITGCGGSGIGFGGRLDGWVIRRNVVERCGTLTKGIVGTGDGREEAFEWTSGIKIWGWGKPGIVGKYEIVENEVRDSLPVDWADGAKATHGHGIWADEVLQPTARPQIQGNRVFNCFSRGIYLEKTDDHDAHDNLVVNCAQAKFTGGMEVQSNPYGYDVKTDRPDNNAPRQVRGNRLFHNTVVGGWWSFSVNCSSPNSSVSDIVVRDNIFVGAGGSSASLYFHGGGANDGKHGSGNQYLNNCFGPEGGSWVWGGGNHRTLAALTADAGKAIQATILGDPLFTNPEAGDYTLQPISPAKNAATDGSDLGYGP